MTYPVLIAAAVIILLAGLYTALRQRHDGEKDDCAAADCSTCASATAACAHERIMAAATESPEYYDDEELDVYKGRSADSYDDEETAQFAYVLETMRPEEVDGWQRSLAQRGIALPAQLLDEMIMLLDDADERA